MTDQTGTEAFRGLHYGEAAFVLATAWDAMSARLIESIGAPAIGTTSGGISWSLGYPDGQGITRRMMIGAVRRITDAVQVPVTADIEGGYGSGSPEDVAETVRLILDIGVVGINLEDSPGEAGSVLLVPARQCERIAAARAAAEAEGIDLFINARIDTFLFEVGEERRRLGETIERARLYIAAGADGIFVPGVTDPPTLGALAAGIGAPLNVMAGPRVPDLTELGRLGVKRVSMGSGLAQLVMAEVRVAVSEALHRGSFDALEKAMPFPEANDLFRSNPVDLSDRANATA